MVKLESFISSFTPLVPLVQLDRRSARTHWPRHTATLLHALQQKLVFRWLSLFVSSAFTRAIQKMNTPHEQPKKDLPPNQQFCSSQETRDEFMRTLRSCRQSSVSNNWCVSQPEYQTKMWTMITVTMGGLKNNHWRVTHSNSMSRTLVQLIASCKQLQMTAVTAWALEN